VSTIPEPQGQPEIVYHYTNAAGLLGILSNNEIWLGDVEFMNDAQELKYARTAVVAQLKAKADSLWPSGKEDSEQSVEWNRAEIIKMVTGFLNRETNEFAIHGYHVYAACFCERPDLLSLDPPIRLEARTGAGHSGAL